jgi:hypothetical protein
MGTQAGTDTLRLSPILHPDGDPSGNQHRRQEKNQSREKASRYRFCRIAKQRDDQHCDGHQHCGYGKQPSLGAH